jgi:AI-2 transport protein TqsA
MSTGTYRQVMWQQWFVGLAIAGIALAILVQGRFFLIPLAIAVLLFSLTSAALERIARLKIGSVTMPHWLASLIGILVIIAAMLAVFRMIAGQIDALIAAGPLYVERGQELVTSMFAWLGEDAAAGIVAAFEEIDLAAYIRALAGSAGYILATAILIVLYVGFLFAESTRFSSKLATLFPDPKRAAHVDRIFRSITRNVHRYILIKTVISILTGLLVYLVLQSFGLQFAETWALLSVFLNFIPNIGSIIATAIPTLVALAQFDSWTPVLLIFAIIGIVQFSVGNLIEPNLMGRSLNLSPFVIILSLTFWGAIWGIVGMFLAVPIMVMVMIVCSHVPPLHPVAVLLSREGVPMPVEETYKPRRKHMPGGEPELAHPD